MAKGKNQRLIQNLSKQGFVIGDYYETNPGHLVVYFPDYPEINRKFFNELSDGLKSHYESTKQVVKIQTIVSGFSSIGSVVSVLFRL